MSEAPKVNEREPAPKDAGARRLWFVIPAFNEGSRIGEVAAAILPHGSVVVVDDGSSDGTALAAHAAGAHVLRMPLNRGQGAALQTGLDYALKEGATHIVTFDADGQHRLEDALRMVERLDRDDLDIVLGSRFLGAAENLSAVRRLVLKAGTIFTNVTTGLKLTDTHNGLRAIRRDAAMKIKLTQDRMAHASEILEIIAEKRLKWAEEPVTIVYTAYSLAKGQRLGNAVRILEELVWGRLIR
ncbi:MAG: glycosyltransferase family 2 protein [Parvularculaceae bacterium]|nr:glycosyltransferase family 2 protein [Parvularculaceae bacterium]